MNMHDIPVLMAIGLICLMFYMLFRDLIWRDKDADTSKSSS